MIVYKKRLSMPSKKNDFIDPTKEKDIISIFELFDKNLKPTYNRWHSKEDAKFYEEKINASLRNFIKPLITSMERILSSQIISILEEAHAAL